MPKILKKSSLLIFLLILISSILIVMVYQIFYLDKYKNETTVSDYYEGVVKQDIPKKDWFAKNGFLINSEDDSEIPVYIDYEHNSVPEQYSINVPSKTFMLENQPNEEEILKMKKAFLDFIETGEEGGIGVYLKDNIQKIEILGFIKFNEKYWIHAKSSSNRIENGYFFGDFCFEKKGNEFIYTEYRHTFGGV